MTEEKSIAAPFIKVYSYNGVLTIVNLNEIALVTEKDSTVLLTMKAVDKDGANIQILDVIRGMETYTNLLNTAANDSKLIK